MIMHKGNNLLGVLFQSLILTQPRCETVTIIMLMFLLLVNLKKYLIMDDVSYVTCDLISCDTDSGN